MKRAISVDLGRWGRLGFGVAMATALSACSAPARQPAPTPPEASSWVTTPLIQSAERTPKGVIMRGLTAPGGRVVVRGATGVGYATSADDQGRFVLQVDLPSADTLFVVETQNGQEAAPAPYRLLVTRDLDGPIALLTPGGPSQRLDRTGPLDAIDSDGRAWLASGRASPGTEVTVALGGRGARELRAGPDGRWVAPMDGGTAAITVAGQVYARPSFAAAAAGPPLTVSPVSGGSLVNWEIPGGSAQSSWFPDGHD